MNSLLLSQPAAQASGNLNLLSERWPVQRRQLVPLIHIVTFRVLGREQLSLLLPVALRRAIIQAVSFIGAGCLAVPT